MTFSEAQAALGGKPLRGGFQGSEAFECACPACRLDGRDNTGNHLVAFHPAHDPYWHFCRCVLGHTEDDIQHALGWTQEDRKCGPADPLAPVPPRPAAPPNPAAQPAPSEFVPAPGPPPPDHGQTWVYLDARKRPALFKKKEWEWKQARPAAKNVAAAPARWDKEFKQWCPDPPAPKAGEEPKPKRKARDVGSRILYNLPDVIAAVKSGAPVYVNEGEKACDAFPPGTVATCQPNGAGALGTDLSTRWTEHHTKLLSGAGEVVIVADSDDVGEAYARYVFGQVKPVAKRVRVVRSKTTGEKDDAHDHLRRAGFKVDEFVPAPDLEADGSWLDAFADLGATNLGGVEAVDVPWLWYPYLPIGRPVLLDGDGDVGKSFMTVALASAVLRGHKPDGKPLPGGPGRVLILASEDRADDTIVPRLEQFGVTPEMRKRVVHIPKLFRFDAAGLAKLDKLVGEFRPTLVIIDPLLAYLGATVNINSSNEVRPILDGIAVVMDRHGAACVLIRHTGKPPSGKDKRPIHHAGIGSVDIRNALRCQLVVQWHPVTKGLRVVTHEKHNLSPQGEPFGYQFRDGEFCWVWKVAMPEGPPAVDLELQRAKDFLERLLLGQRAKATYCIEEAKKVHISERTLNRAKGPAGVVSKPEGGVWYWTIPASEDDPFYA